MVEEDDKNEHPHTRVRQEEIAKVAFGAHPLVRIDTEHPEQKTFDRPKKPIESAVLFVIHRDHISAQRPHQEYPDHDDDYNRDD